MMELMTKEADTDEHAFETVTDALLWAGWAETARRERGRAGSIESRSMGGQGIRPFACDDVFLVLRRALNENAICSAEFKIVKWFINYGAPPDDQFPDHIHAKWDSALEALKPYLQRKGIVYRDA